MGAVMVPLAVCLVGIAVMVLWRQRARALRTGNVDDVPQRLLAASVALLAAERAEWGQAMIGELDRLTSRSERWRFVLGCARVTLLVPPRQGGRGRLTRTVVPSAAVACIGLVGYGLIRYPGVITGAGTWLSVTAFLAVLAGYTGIASVIIRGLCEPALGAVRVALLCATLILALWIVVGVAASFGGSDYVGTLLLLVVPMTSLSVGVVGTWHGRGASVGRQAAVLFAVGAGMLTFLLWVGQTLLTGGRPYNPGMVRDFQSSRAPDLATYAVNDNMGSAMMLLVLVPMLATLVGLAGTAITARLLPRTPGTD
jgi:hypothetical protein